MSIENPELLQALTPYLNALPISDVHALSLASINLNQTVTNNNKSVDYSKLLNKFSLCIFPLREKTVTHDGFNFGFRSILMLLFHGDAVLKPFVYSLSLPESGADLSKQKFIRQYNTIAEAKVEAEAKAEAKAKAEAEAEALQNFTKSCGLLQVGGPTLLLLLYKAQSELQYILQHTKVGAYGRVTNDIVVSIKATLDKVLDGYQNYPIFYNKDSQVPLQKAAQEGAGCKTNKTNKTSKTNSTIVILGRKRKVYVEGRKKMITYKGARITLTEAKTLEKKRKH